MNDIEFIETLKQKRNACDYSQSRLAQELQISSFVFIFSLVFCNSTPLLDNGGFMAR